mmetsp:Transcript_5860/g.9841  ORF Transcript_5860/g.9841 Transcript_5860/m.9841 type:complete len:81 (+) Transcript_5860:470-712(+)
MATTLPHPGALNPRVFRAYHSGVTRPHELKGVLDTVLLRRFNSLDFDTQDRLAKQIGTTVLQLKANLLELEVLLESALML